VHSRYTPRSRWRLHARYTAGRLPRSRGLQQTPNSLRSVSSILHGVSFTTATHPRACVSTQMRAQHNSSLSSPTSQSDLLIAARSSSVMSSCKHRRLPPLGIALPTRLQLATSMTKRRPQLIGYSRIRIRDWSHWSPCKPAEGPLDQPQRRHMLQTYGCV
jgi:hypothetical protein